MLAEAYALMRRDGRLPAGRLEAAGYIAPEHHGYLEKIQAGLAAAGLAGEFRYHGALDREAKMRFLRSLDVASVPSPYAEPKGMSVLEALACGTPVVQPRHGAFPGDPGPHGRRRPLRPRRRGGPRGRGRRSSRRSVHAGRRWASRARAACGASTRSARMAERAIEVYDEALREAAPAAAPG